MPRRRRQPGPRSSKKQVFASCRLCERELPRHAFLKSERLGQPKGTETCLDCHGALESRYSKWLVAERRRLGREPSEEADLNARRTGVRELLDQKFPQRRIARDLEARRQVTLQALLKLQSKLPSAVLISVAKLILCRCTSPTCPNRQGQPFLLVEEAVRVRSPDQRNLLFCRTCAVQPNSRQSLNCKYVERRVQQNDDN